MITLTGNTERRCAHFQLSNLLNELLVCLTAKYTHAQRQVIADLLLTTTLPYENERGGSKTIKWGNKERLQVAATTSNTERFCYHCRLARIGRSYNCNIANVYSSLRTLLFMSWLRHCKSYENRITFLTRLFI